MRERGEGRNQGRVKRGKKKEKIKTEMKNQVHPIVCYIKTLLRQKYFELKGVNVVIMGSCCEDVNCDTPSDILTKLEKCHCGFESCLETKMSASVADSYFFK